MTAPPPIITTRETAEWPEEWYPSAMRAFAKRARAAGWSVRMGFSRGYVAGQAIDSWEVRDVIGVWLDGYGRRAVASWMRNPEAEFTQAKLDKGIQPGEIPSGMAWKFTNGAVILGKGQSFPWMNADETAEWVKLQGNVLPSWYVAVKTRFQEAEFNRKTKARAKLDNEAAERSEVASMNARMT